MADAATGGRAILARAIEKTVLGVPQGDFEFLNFDSVDITRLDDEQKSAAITGNEGMDRGTPSDIKFDDKVKYSMTASRILFDLVAMHGAPASITPVGGVEIASASIGTAGDDYVDGTVYPIAGDGAGGTITIHASSSPGPITSVTVTTPGAGYTTASVDLTGDGDGNGVINFGLGSAAAWLVKIRPQRTNAIRAASLYLFEGGSYSATMQTGRRTQDITMADAANKRTEVSITYSDPTGDTIAGFIIGKSSNADASFQGSTVKRKLFTRGRRPYDSNFDSGLSLYLKVTDKTSDAVTFKAAYASPSNATDGTGFATPTYSTVTFICPKPSADFDGYTAVVMDAPLGTIGLFGENFEAFEVCVPIDLGGSNIGVDDEFEIPVSMPALTKSVVPETRLSAFHLIRKLGGSTDVRIDKGTTKLERPYKPYRANGRRIPQAIDPQGDSSATFSFSKRLFDRFFRKISDAHSRFTIFDNYRNETPIAGTSAHESVQIFAPQCAVTALKSGDIATKNVLEETVTLFAEQPDVTPSVPTDFDASTAYPVQINIITKIDPSWLGA